MVAQSHLTIGLPHLVVGCCLANPKGSIGFLQSDIHIRLPLALLPLVAGKVVCRIVAKGEMDNRTPIHGVDEPTQQETENESTTSTYIPTYNGKDEFEAKQT
jgi:hypothetical protein